MLRSKPSGDQKEELAGQRSKAKHRLCGRRENGPCDLPKKASGAQQEMGGVWLEIGESEAELPWAQLMGPGANT